MRTIRPKCLDFALAEFYRSVHWDNGAAVKHISKSGLGAQGGKSYLDRSFFTGESMFQRVLCVSAFVLLFASGFAVPAAAQSNDGRFLGTVTDSQGKVVVGAKIAITNTGTGTTRNLESNGAGDYAAPALQPGLYTVMAEARGFKKVEHSNIRLEVGNDARIDFQLVPGALDETIQVTAEAPLITTTNDTIGGSLSNKEINDLPLNGRDYQNLVVLRPGVVRFPGGGFESIAANGMRPEDNNFVVDGSDDNDPYYSRQYHQRGRRAGNAGINSAHRCDSGIQHGGKPAAGYRMEAWRDGEYRT